MNYYFTKETGLGYDEAVAKVKNELKLEGFGIISEIDISATLKQKIGVDFRKYMILGACNPNFAFQALSLESRIGTMLPCNIIVQLMENGRTEVSAINPMETMKAVANPQLERIGSEVAAKLEAVVGRI